METGNSVWMPIFRSSTKHEDEWKELAKKYPDENLEIVRAMLKEGDGEEVHGCMFCIV